MQIVELMAAERGWWWWRRKAELKRASTFLKSFKAGEGSPKTMDLADNHSAPA